MKPIINYSFHIGERCQSYHFFRKYNLISAANPFSGTSISFENSIKLIESEFKNYLNNILCFNLGSNKNIKITNKTKKYDNIENFILKCKFLFFFKENFYLGKSYSIHLDYTNLNNFNTDDIFFWNNYFIMPGVDYSNKNQIDNFIRRKNRFLDILHNKNSINILLIYQFKLCNYSLTKDIIKQVINVYFLPYHLLFIIPIYFDNNENELFTEKIVIHKNITFYLIKFPDLMFQSINNPGDDNVFKDNKIIYLKIKNKINEIYNMNLKNIF